MKVHRRLNNPFGKGILFVAITTLIGVFPTARYTYGRLMGSIPDPGSDLGHGSWHYEMGMGMIITYFPLVSVVTLIGAIVLGKRNLKILPLGVALAILQFTIAVWQLKVLFWMID